MRELVLGLPRWDGHQLLGGAARGANLGPVSRAPLWGEALQLLSLRSLWLSALASTPLLRAVRRARGRPRRGTHRRTLIFVRFRLFIRSIFLFQ